MIRDEARDLFERHNRYPGDALLFHCLRINDFTLALSRDRGVSLDEDLLYAGCLLHDIGLLVTDSDEPNYLVRGAKFAVPYLRDWDLDKKSVKLVEEVLLYNHSLRPVPGAGAMAELVREAVQIEHSFGRVTHGLPRATCRAVFARYPRKGLTKILVDFARITIMQDGAHTLVPIFFPRRRRL